MDYENSDLSEREKMGLRYADFVKYKPQGVTDEFMKELQEHFSDAEICEIGYILLAYGGAHNFLSSIGEDVIDENGNSLVRDDGIFGKEGFPLVFNTHQAQRLSGRAAPQPQCGAARDAVPSPMLRRRPCSPTVPAATTARSARRPAP